jgi:ribosome assembly protein RRB1
MDSNEEKYDTNMEVVEELEGGDHEESEEQTQELVYDESAYVMYHRAQTDAPCLSFDVISDTLGNGRENFPLSCYIVGGTQAERSQANCVIVMKLSNLCKTQKNEESEDDDDDDDSDSDSDDTDGQSKKPGFAHSKLRHTGTVNRIRATVIGEKRLAATWAETGRVHIWDLNAALTNVDSPSPVTTPSSQSPLYTFSGHQIEGYAIDWNSIERGRLATGDCKHNIHLWQPQSGGTWHVDQRPCSAHTASVEDIQWSPSEPNVFASCSVDKSIRVWDSRSPPNKACKITIDGAHDSDVNVISWNHTEQHFIASGGDDGVIKVWDLRQYKRSEGSSAAFSPVVFFRYHTAPVTSVEWNPNDASVLAVASADDRITIWDFAVESDDVSATEGTSADKDNVPPQLLFVHQGQKEIKELHWHQQLPGVIISTANDGFNIFRTISA